MSDDKQLSPEDTRQKWEKERYERMQAARKKDARRFAAAQVMAALLSSPHFDPNANMGETARCAVQAADALLKELGE